MMHPRYTIKQVRKPGRVRMTANSIGLITLGVLLLNAVMNR